eukprot:258679-Karenia_brevis.AAC.1
MLASKIIIDGIENAVQHKCSWPCRFRHPLGHLFSLVLWGSKISMLASKIFIDAVEHLDVAVKNLHRWDRKWGPE